MRRRALRLSALLLGAVLLSTVAALAADRLADFYDLRKPSGPGPFSAVIMVGGCSGYDTKLFKPVYDRLRDRFVEAGFLTVRVELLKTRGLAACYAQSKYLVTQKEVAADIAQTISDLLATGEVDAARINLVGGSFGGGSVLEALSDAAAAPRVHAIVAYYPDCRNLDEWAVSKPTLLLHGGADTVVPFAICRALLARITDKAPIETTEYPSVCHGFDAFTLPEKTQYVFGIIGYNPRAAAQAWDATIAFLKRQLCPHAWPTWPWLYSGQTHGRQTLDFCANNKVRKRVRTHPFAKPFPDVR
jgi:dienelactone hydrolase